MMRQGYQVMALVLQGIGTTKGEPFTGERVIEPGQVLRIGRSHENGWVLSDPTLRISKRHCALSHEEGRYIITDLSTNGAFLDDETTPVGCGASRPLMDGQTLRIGDYRFVVNIDAEETHGDVGRTHAVATVSSILDGTTRRESPRAGALAGSADALAQTFSRSRRAPSRPIGWDAPPDTAPPPVFARLTPDAGRSDLADYLEHAAAVQTVVRLAEIGPMLPDDWNEPSATAASNGGGTVSVLRPADRATDPDPTQQRLIAAFLNGAGLPANAADAMNPEAVLREAGRMLRVAVQSTRKLLASVASIESETAVGHVPVRAARNAAFEASGDAADELKKWMAPPSRGGVSGAESMSQSFAEIAAHEAALRAAIHDVLAVMTAAPGPAAAKADVKARRRQPWFAGGRKSVYRDAFEADGRPRAGTAMRLFLDAYAQHRRET
jgi:type VI secretion system protein